MSNQPTAKSTWIAILVVALIPVLLYAPLALSLLEDKLLGTDHVYNLFNRIGLADLLGVIYEPVVDLLM